MRIPVKTGARIEHLRGSLWFLPTLSVLAALALAAALTHLTMPAGSVLAPLVTAIGPDGARGMLQAIAGSVITVTSLVFSLTVVTLQLASGQFSPRLLRTFLRDRANQVVLSIHLATFALCLALLATVRAEGAAGGEFVPKLGVGVALLFALASTAALVYFISHIADSIRVDHMMRAVEQDTLAVIDKVHGEQLRPGDAPDPMPGIPVDALPLPARASGTLDAVGPEQLVDLAVRHHLVLRLDPALGDHVVAGAPLAWVWPSEGVRVPDADLLADELQEAVEIGFERTLQRDVGFGIRQLVDIAAKALSPGVNDPTTAVDAIGHLAPLVCTLAGRRLDPLVCRDGADQIRVAVPRTDFPTHLDTACGQIRRYGAGEPAVTGALLWMLRQVATFAVTDCQRHEIAAQANLIVAAAERETRDPADLARVHAAAERTYRTLAGDRQP